MTWTLSDTANLARACLHQHRLLSTRQLQQLLHPDRTLRTTQRLLADLAGQELVSSVRERGGRPRAMRRTYISIALLANNFDVKWVMSQVGHADSKMTMDVYAQLEQRVDRSHGTNFDTLIRKARHQPATTNDEPEPQRTLHAVA
jgi:integrase